MPTILDFQIQPLSAESYSLTVCERGSSQSLASATFSHRVDFLTDFSVDRLNASTQDAGDRFYAMKDLGAQLYQKLFPPAVEQVWREYKQRSEFLILCLRFAEAATKLEVLPWETLHDGAEFIAAGAKTTLTRLPLDVAPPSELPPLPRPLRLFGFFASPLDLKDNERLNVEREQEILLEAINDPAGQGRISADFEDEAKLEILARSLRDGYHILHFTGHGISPRDGGGLLLEDAHGKKLPASIAEVMQAVQRGQDGNAKLRLAVISGCQTARTLHTGAFNDLARELLRQRVPAVIAMQFSISDDGGLKFAEVLYKEIAKGVELERAAHAARRVLLEDERFFINNDALAIVLLAADGACLQTTEAQSLPPQAEPGATYLGDRLDPLAHGFYGRRREYRKIRDALLHQDQRAVIIHGIIIHGMGGIGKTALLTHAINRLRPSFKDVMSFDCRRAALAPETILLELHRYFATQGKPQLQSLIGQNVQPETLADEIAKLLTEWPLLIVFDNFESQLDERREFINEDLRVFLTTLVRATAKGSRFLFTTRVLFDLDGKRLGNLQKLPLGDLSRAEALMLMQKLPNLAQATHRDKLAALEKFGGHPYALVTLDQHCSHQPLGQALQDASSLESELREFLAIELNYRRLSDRARELLNRLAAFRIGVPFTAAEWVMGEEFGIPLLQESKKSREGEPLNLTVHELIDWGLLTPQVEDGELQSLVVHGLTRDFCRDKLERKVWRIRLRDAAAFYTTQTKLMRRNDKPPVAVWGEMEAFELLMEAEDFEEAARLLISATPLLDRWGFGCFLKRQYFCLLDKAGRQINADLTHNYGMLLHKRGNYEAALKEYQKSLTVSDELGDRAGVTKTLHQIGILHQDQGHYKVALEYHDKSRKIAKELGDVYGIASSLFWTGNVHFRLHEQDVAMECYKQAMEMLQKLSDSISAINLIGQIGLIHQERGEYEAALTHFDLSLRAFEELNDQAGVAYVMHNIGIIYEERGEYEEALARFEKSLRIKEELGDRAGLITSLHQIGNLYFRCKNYEEARKHYEKSLKIAEELGDRVGVAGASYQIGIIDQALGDDEAAIKQYENSFAVFDEIGDQAGIASSRAQVGQVFTRLGRCPEAFRLLFFAFATFVNLKSPDAGIVVNMLKYLHAKWGKANFDAAWREATNEEVPEWLADESEAAAS